MNTFELKIWYDEGSRCTFYTILQEGATITETDKFFIRYDFEEHEHYESALKLLTLILDVIGSDYGATDDFFDRLENKAQALPPKPKKWIPEIEELGLNFPLRLYCLRISESLVVLFNGGIKEGRTSQSSPGVGFVFQEAQTMAQRIMDAVQNGLISVSADGKHLIDYNGEIDLILI